MRIINRRQRFDDRKLFNFLMYLATPTNTGCVYDRVVFTVTLIGNINAVSGCARFVKNYHAFFTEHSIYQRGLTHIWSTDNSYLDARRFIKELFTTVDLTVIKLRHMGRDTFVNHATNAMSVACGDHKGIAEAKVSELSRDVVGILTINFVGNQHHGTLVDPQRFGDVLISGRSATFSIYQKKDKVCFTNRLMRLIGHRLFNTIDIISGNTAGIYHDVTKITHGAFAVLSITGKPRKLSNNGIPGAGQPIKQRRLANIRSADKSNDRNHFRNVLP